MKLLLNVFPDKISIEMPEVLNRNFRSEVLSVSLQYYLTVT